MKTEDYSLSVIRCFTCEILYFSDLSTLNTCRVTVRCYQDMILPTMFVEVFEKDKVTKQIFQIYGLKQKQF